MRLDGFSRFQRTRKRLSMHRDSMADARSPLAGERHILELIALGVPLSGVLNTLCAAVDMQIGSIVSLVLLADQEETDLHTIVQSAGDFGLHIFCSAAILSENSDVLGTLEIFCCDRRSPSAKDLHIIDRAAHLAAVAIQNPWSEDPSGAFSRKRNSNVSRRLPAGISFIN